MNKLLPNHKLSFQAMKKKNTGAKQIIQGHQAKMNSSDWSGLEEESAEGWTQVFSKSSKKMLRKKQKLQEKKSSERNAQDLSSESRSRSRSASRSRSESRDADRVSGMERQEETPVVMGAQVEDTEQEQVPSGKREKRSRSVSRVTGATIIPETPLPRQVSSSKASSKKKGKLQVVKLNADDGLTMDDHIAELIKSGESGKLRDIDPSSKPPAPSLVGRVAEMLTADSTNMPPFELGIPSTRRRLAALRRLKRVLGIKSLQAELLLTASALTHDHGKENYAQALALGKYIKHGAQMHDGAEEHRIYLRAQLNKLRYSDAQVNLALADLEPSLGIFNVTAIGVQGWLVRQALAYNQEQERAQAGNGEDVCRSSRCYQKAKKQSALHKVDSLLRANGMDKAAAAIHQAANAVSTPSKNQSAAPAADSGSRVLSDAVNDIHRDVAAEDPYWDKPPAVKQFLIMRDNLRLRMQQICTISPSQLLRTFDTLIATWPTFVEAVQYFPAACGVKFELSEFLQRQMEEMKVSIRELELGSRMFLSDILERSCDLVVQQLNGYASRKLAEAEFMRSFKRCGNSNEAMQYVVKVLKSPAVPTPSWRQRLCEKTMIRRKH
jgi:hypothetical protein